MRYVIIVLVLALIVYLVMDFNSRTADLTRLRAERDVVQAQLNSLDATKAALEAEIAFATSDRAVEQWAYENHLARPGDNPVVPVASALGTPVPPARAVVTPTAVSYLERWLSLFIDPPVQ